MTPGRYAVISFIRTCRNFLMHTQQSFASLYMGVIMYKKTIVLVLLAVLLAASVPVQVFCSFDISLIPDNTVKLGDDFFSMTSNAMKDPNATIPIQSLLKTGPNKNKAYFKYGGRWYDVFALNSQQFLNPAYAMTPQQVNALTGFNKWYKPGDEVVDLTGSAPAPGVPQNVKAESGDDSITLTWDAVTGAAGYKVSMSDKLDGTYSETLVTASTHTAFGLAEGKTYFFKIKATNGSTDSAFSQTVSGIASIDRSGSTYSGRYLVVSNESINAGSFEPSGALPDVEAMLQKVQSGLEQEAYAIDIRRPVPKVDKDKLKSLVPKNTDALEKKLGIGEISGFYTYNFVTGWTELLSFQLMYSGSGCDIWVDTRNNAITVQMAQQMGQEYDSRMDPLIRQNFYDPSDIDNNGRVNVLCFDIQDGFTGSGGYIAGYFDPTDLFPANGYNPNPYPNLAEVLYIDTYPTMGLSVAAPDVTSAYSTIVHELQHEANFNNWLEDMAQVNEMDLWLDEAFSMAAQHLYNGTQISRINYYNVSPAVASGRSLMYWDNSYDVLANYSLSYLFSQYLWAQTIDQVPAGSSIFKEMIDDSNSDYRVVEKVIQKYLDPSMSFGNFMTAFRTALVLNAPSGLYGFNGMSGLDALSVRTYSGSSASLRGGGAVVKAIPGSFTDADPGDQGADVRYVGVFD